MAVIAILATLAVPAYWYRIVRDQINKALSLADIAKQPIAACWPVNHSLDRAIALDSLGPEVEFYRQLQCSAHLNLDA